MAHFQHSSWDCASGMHSLCARCKGLLLVLPTVAENLFAIGGAVDVYVLHTHHVLQVGMYYILARLFNNLILSVPMHFSSKASVVIYASISNGIMRTSCPHYTYYNFIAHQHICVRGSTWFMNSSHGGFPRWATFLNRTCHVPVSQGNTTSSWTKVSIFRMLCEGFAPAESNLALLFLWNCVKRRTKYTCQYSNLVFTWQCAFELGFMWRLHTLGLKKVPHCILFRWYKCEQCTYFCPFIAGVISAVLNCWAKLKAINVLTYACFIHKKMFHKVDELVIKMY